MRPSLFSIWTGLWVLISLASIAAVGYIYYTSKEQIYIDDDYPGANPPADYWRGGEFFGYPATKMRRIERTSGFPTDREVSFFAEVPINAADFQHNLEQWKSDPGSSFRKHDPVSEFSNEYLPSWFPTLTPETHVGDLIDSSRWRITLFRAPDADCMYLIAY